MCNYKEGGLEVYKPSKFNYLIEKDNKLCFFNSLTGSLGETENDEVKKILKSESINNDVIFFERLLKDGFIVKDDFDEDAIADVKYFDLIANKDLYLTLMPTTACNYRCAYCYENSPNDPNNFPNKYMNYIVQTSILKYISKHIKEFYGLTIEWYGGEPLLEISTINKLSKQFVHICHENRKPLIATLTTNGYYLTKDVFEQMLSNHIIKFHVTIDGFSEIHNKYRKLKNGEGTFNRILENLRDIRDNVKSSYFSIVIRTNITIELLPRLDEWIKFLYDEFGSDKRFKFFFRAAEDRGGESVKSISKSLINSIDEAYDIMINSKYKLDYSIYYATLQNSLCMAAKRNAYIIDPEGIIKKCGEHLNDDIVNVGYINAVGNMVIYKDKFAKWVRKKDIKDSLCNICKLKPACNNSSCPMKANFLYKDNQCACGYEHTNIYNTIDLLTNGKNYSFVKIY